MQFLVFNKALEQAEIAEKLRENIANVKGKLYFKSASISLGFIHLTKHAIRSPHTSQNEMIYILFISRDLKYLTT